MNKKLLALSLLSALGSTAYAQSIPPCPVGVTSCTTSVQTVGDVDNSASADHTMSNSSQAGNSAASIATGNAINGTYDNRAQTTQNATNTTRGDITSDNHSLATGNTSTNSNQSSASTGASTSSSNGTNAQGQGQQQAATGGAGGSGGSAYGGAVGNTSSRSEGSTSASLSGSSADGSGNSQTSIDASDRSVNNSKSNFMVLPDQPAVPMSFSPSSQVTATADPQCGPVQEVISTPLYGYFFGTFKTKKVELDHNDTLAPPTGDAMNSEWGARAIYTTSVVNVAGARSLSLGGGGGSGWGQGSGGASSSMTVMVTHITMRACRMVQPQQKVLVIHDAPQVVMSPKPKPIRKPRRAVHAVAPACPPVAEESY